MNSSGKLILSGWNWKTPIADVKNLEESKFEYRKNWSSQRKDFKILVWRAFSLHQNDGKMDGELLENQVVTMDKGRKEKLEMEEPVLVPKIVHITRQVLEWFGFRARCRGWMSMHSDGTTRSHRICQRRPVARDFSSTEGRLFSAMPHFEVKMMHTLQESAQEDENKDQLR